MDGELNEDSPSQTETASNSYADIFNSHFPYYLSTGMTERQYWDGDNQLPKYYRKADELRKERLNQEMWLQGMYIYDALLRVAPRFSAFGGKDANPSPYVEEPYPITEKGVQERLKKEEQNKFENIKRRMDTYMVENNRRFEDER